MPTLPAQKIAVPLLFRSGRWLIDTKAIGAWEGASGFELGNEGDSPLIGRWSGTSASSVGVFRDGKFSLLINGKVTVYNFGSPGDTPVVGDWTGDGVTKVGVFRKGFWLLDMNGNGRWDGASADRLIGLGGVAGEVPLIGDWNGDGRSKAGVYYLDGSFALDFNGNGAWDKDDKKFFFGQKGDIPVVGDWSGNGVTKAGVFRKGFWLLDMNGNGHWDGPPGDRLIGLGGVVGDVPLVGDWNGDGRAKAGIYRADGSFAFDFNGNGVWDKDDRLLHLGAHGDLPVILNPVRDKK